MILAMLKYVMNSVNVAQGLFLFTLWLLRAGQERAEEIGAPAVTGHHHLPTPGFLLRLRFAEESIRPMELYVTSQKTTLG